MAKTVRQKLRLQLARVGSKARPPTFQTILGQRSGVFIVEFCWRKPGAHNWHAVAVNCEQRRVFCNTLGVVPFQLEHAKESPETHAGVVQLFSVRSVSRVWRMLQRNA